MHGVGSVGGR